MNLYLAAVYAASWHLQSALYTQLTDREKEARTGIKWHLESYHYIWKDTYTRRLYQDKTKVFLDSGAFSAFTQDMKMDLPEYCKFIQKNAELIAVDDRSILASVLDAIGKGPEETLKNQQAMESLGVRPLPCFHYGEDEKYLEYYITNYDYVTLGGMVPISTPQLYPWLDRIWDKHLTDGAGRPRCKIHGFGLTSYDLMERYPWYCMTEEDHEVLTKDGWAGLSCLSEGTEILTYDNGDAVWSSISKVHRFAVTDEELYYSSNRYLTAATTENHNWLLEHRDARNTRKFKNTKDMLYAPGAQNWLIPRVGRYAGPEEPTYSTDFCSLAGWFWTDGSIKRRKRYKTDSVVIYQSDTANPEKVAEIRELLKRMGEHFCEYTDDRKNGTIVIFELYGDAAKLLLAEFPNKHLTWKFIFGMQKTQLTEFIRTSVLGDGTKTPLKRTSGFSLLQKSPLSIHMFQTAVFLSGTPATLNSYEDKYEVIASSISHLNPDRLVTTKKKYTGVVWCVSVPSRAFFVRNAGRIFVTGNSVDSSSWARTSATGSIMVPFDGGIRAISVSNDSPARRVPGQHIDTMPPVQKEALRALLDRQGFSLERMQETYLARWSYNVWAFTEINSRLSSKERVFKNELIDLFQDCIND